MRKSQSQKSQKNRRDFGAPTLKTNTPQIWGVTIHPPNLSGESSQITCFTVFFEGCFLNLGGEIFTPQIWGVNRLPPKLWGVCGFQGQSTKDNAHRTDGPSRC